jgi:NAD dependent epimerase/dehydratase family
MEQLASDTSSFEGGPPFSAEPHGWGISMSVSGEFQRARSATLSCWRVSGIPRGYGEPAVPLPSCAGQTEPRRTNIYTATKLAQENMLAAWTAAHDTNLSLLRLQNVDGPGQSLTNPYTGIVALFA